MFHFVGVTPEAPTRRGGARRQRAAENDAHHRRGHRAVYAGYSLGDGDARLVVFSGPQQSLFEMKRLAELFDGQQACKPGSSCFVTTNGAVLAQSRALGYAQTLEAAGVTILEGVCFYILQNLSPMRERERLDQHGLELGEDREHHRRAPLQHDPAAHRGLRGDRVQRSSD